VVHRTARGNWDGYSMSGRVGLDYLAEFGAFFLEPRVHADYFRLSESSYSETGGGEGFDLAVNGRTGDAFTVTGSVVAGMTWGSTGFHWRPEVEVGYRSVISGNAGTTTANFIGANEPFTLVSESIRQGSVIGRLGLHVYANYLDLLLDGGAQYNKDYTDIDVHLTARTVF
jgi:outer membrane autotransporter protein